MSYNPVFLWNMQSARRHHPCSSTLFIPGFDYTVKPSLRLSFIDFFLASTAWVQTPSNFLKKISIPCSAVRKRGHRLIQNNTIFFFGKVRPPFGKFWVRWRHSIGAASPPWRRHCKISVLVVWPTPELPAKIIQIVYDSRHNGSRTVCCRYFFSATHRK